MKLIMFVFLAVSSLFWNADENLDAINKAMKAGDASALSQYFDKDIELTILSNVDILSKQEKRYSE